MKRQLINLILFLFLVVVTSCNKNDHLINIKATNIVTGESYAELKFSVVAQTPGVFESHYKNVYEGYLDANGEASFELKMKENKSYELGIELPEGTCYFNDLYFSLQHNQAVQNVVVEFVPCAYLKLKITNVNCEGADDTLALYQGNEIQSFDYSQAWIHKGCVVWESPGGTDGDPIGYSSVPMGAQYYMWEVIRTSGTNIFYDTLYLNEGEYKTYEINY